MKKTVKLAALVLSLCTAASGFCVRAYADTAAWDIENSLDVSECRQGDTVTMSVNLKGASASASQEIASMSGTLEYDTSLFTVEKADILPEEAKNVQEYSFDRASGIFKVQYTSDRTVKDGDLLLHIKLHTAADASTGKTTLCVTDMQWKSTKSDKETEIEHHVPAKITIASAKDVSAGDVNQDGEVNLIDAKLVMQYYNGAIELDAQQQKNADTNGDGKVNLTDAKRIMQYYNGEIESLSQEG